MKLQMQEKDYYGSFYYLEYILCKPNPLLYKEDTGRMFLLGLPQCKIQERCVCVLGHMSCKCLELVCLCSIPLRSESS